MSKTNKTTVKANLTNKMVLAHACILLGVCVIFGAISFFNSNITNGIIIIACGAFAFALSFILKKTAIATRGFVLSVIQLVTIIVMSIANHEMHTLFPLMIASMAITAIYYNKAALITQESTSVHSSSGILQPTA